MNWFATTLLLWLIVVATMDFKYRKVKNIVFLLGLFYVLICLNINQNRDIWDALGAGGLVFFILLPFYALKGMGAGDVKFGVVVGMIWGLSLNLIMVMVIASMLSMLHAILFLNLKNKNIYFLSFAAFVGFENFLIKKSINLNMRGSIPFAAYLAIATVFWMLYESPP